MSDDSAFSVEEFLEAIAAQLDRAQDALVIKAQTRPLTYAVKDFSLDLQVFVEMDEEGNVRFRPSAPGETGASRVEIGFTTITRPMIEENTISLATMRTPSLEEAGLEKGERRRLERLGVRNIGQLEDLDSSTGTSGVSRLSGVPIERIRRAIKLGRPLVSDVKPVEPVRRGQRPERRPEPPPKPPKPPRAPLEPPRRSIPTPPEGVLRPARTMPSPPPRPAIQVPKDALRLRLAGRNLLSRKGPPTVRLNERPLQIAAVDDGELEVLLPADAHSGTLEIELPDGELAAYDLDFYPPEDPWAPVDEGGS